MKNKYPSIFSPGKMVAGHQLIVEIVCKNRASHLKRDLPIKFWELPEWLSYYKSQLRKCSSLLQKYSEEAIIRAVKNKNIWSLMAKWVEDEIKKEQTRLDSIIITVSETPVIENASKRQSRTKNLDYLDN